jgi:hypothetical protein
MSEVTLYLSRPLPSQEGTLGLLPKSHNLALTVLSVPSLALTVLYGHNLALTVLYGHNLALTVLCMPSLLDSGRNMTRQEGRCKATWKREFKLPQREAGPPNCPYDEVDTHE